MTCFVGVTDNETENRRNGEGETQKEVQSSPVEYALLVKNRGGFPHLAEIPWGKAGKYIPIAGSSKGG